MRLAAARCAALLALAGCVAARADIAPQWEERPDGPPPAVQKTEPAAPAPAAPASAAAAAPAAIATGSPAAAERALWLESPLYGSDNDMAALRKVRIVAAEGGYRAHIANQFSFACALEFGADGRPAMLRDCRPELAENATWGVREPAVKLRCATRSAEIVCQGAFTLTASDDYESAGLMTIARRR